MPDPASNRSSSSQLSETIELVTTYVKQETIGPLRGAGRWIGFGLAGALTLAMGLSFLLLGLLRLLQTEAKETFDGNWSWAPYGITLCVAAGIIAIAASRIRKETLQRKEPR